jgi:hypothetical protein
MSGAVTTPGNRTEKTMRAKSNLLKRFNLIWVVQSPLAKIFRFPCTPNQWFFRAVSTRQEGRIAIVTDAGRDVVDATASARMMVAGRGRTRERFTSRKTNDACCVRQNRVVLTPVAGAKLSGGEINSTELDQP